MNFVAVHAVVLRCLLVVTIPTCKKKDSVFSVLPGIQNVVAASRTQRLPPKCFTLGKTSWYSWRLLLVSARTVVRFVRPSGARCEVSSARSFSALYVPASNWS
eukprot:TRINITY_DN3523_c0_g1_i1.p1 TRINITY_DN3523_c0_g1~~TRINITY_DN3523_c0_g1_i1.p1  ORF type:complete len:103 (-),score=1.74 TRINITY_DN3523_c0_g1_i1:204-512(-)